MCLFLLTFAIEADLRNTVNISYTAEIVALANGFLRFFLSGCVHDGKFWCIISLTIGGIEHDHSK